MRRVCYERTLMGRGEFNTEISLRDGKGGKSGDIENVRRFD